MHACPAIAVFGWIFPSRKLLFFSLTSYPAEIAYLSSPNWELSNGVRLVLLYWNKNVDLSRSPCLKTVDGKRFERRNFLVLCPVLLKNAYFSSANRQLSNNVLPKELLWRKIANPSRGKWYTLSRAKFFCSPAKKKSSNFFVFWPILLKMHI